MADLQNIAPKPGMVPQERLLGRLLRISHQQDGSAAGLKQSDQRAVIYSVSRDILRRTEERERSAALQRERLAVIRTRGVSLRRRSAASSPSLCVSALM